ncbi:MAG: helix-turn-helix domain-containing protein [Actinomycetota bacterium]|nr:helix-turn-helix domain-containing protein [Actinomycetota bacterium]
MQAGRELRAARRRARLSQRALAARTGVAQPTIARIERGQDDPRVGTLDRLLRACDETLATVPLAGSGIDRTEIRVLLALTPAQRVASVADEARLLDRLTHARRID